MIGISGNLILSLGLVGALSIVRFRTAIKDSFTDRVEFLHPLISPYVIGQNGENTGLTFLKSEEEFINSKDTLLKYIEERIALASKVTAESKWEYEANSAQKNTEKRREMNAL